MNYALIRENDIANGPGIRTSLFVSGCRHHCKGCFNPETWNFNYGEPFTQKEIDRIIEATKPSFVEGLTLLGGEPFEPENQAALIELLTVQAAFSLLLSIFHTYAHPLSKVTIRFLCGTNLIKRILLVCSIL